MQTSFRNGLHVVEDNTTFTSVDAALYEVDNHLFLTWEAAGDRKLYRVLYDRGENQSPAEIARWVNERQEPLPLSHGLVDLVKSLRPRDGNVDLEASRKANEEREQAELEAFEEEVDAIAAEGVRWMKRRSEHHWLGASRTRARDRSRYRRMGITDA